MEEKKQTRKIPVRKLAKGVYRANLRRSIRRFERRYEMKSDKMCDLLTAGKVRETAEIIKWMQHFHVLRSLNGKTHMAGTHGTTTVQSTIAD